MRIYKRWTILLITLYYFLSCLHAQDPCNWYPDCGQCAADLRCGWCSNAMGSLTVGQCISEKLNATCTTTFSYYACDISSLASVENVHVYPNKWAYYSFTPKTQNQFVHFILGATYGNDNFELLVRKNARPTTYKYDYKSKRKLSPMYVTLKNKDFTRHMYTGAWDVFYIGIMGDNHYPMKTGVSDYVLSVQYDFSFEEFGCAGVDRDCTKCGLTGLGNAICQDSLLLTLKGASRIGAIYLNALVQVSKSFESWFQFRITSDCGENTFCAGGDGFAFIILLQQSSLPPNQIAKGAGASLGYGCSDELCTDGIQNAVVIEFDTFINRDKYDPVQGTRYMFDENNVRIESYRTYHVAVLKSQNILKSAHNDKYQHLATSLTAPDFGDGKIHTAKIQYAQERLTVFVDDMYVPVIDIRLQMDEGITTRSVVGFSASTGRAPQSHEIISWRFCRNFNCEAI